MNMFENLSLFGFKNCRFAHFMGMLLVKLLAKLPLKHTDSFRG